MRPLCAVTLEEFIDHGSYCLCRLALLLAPALLASGQNFSFNSKLLHRNLLKGGDLVHGEKYCHCCEESEWAKFAV